MKKIFEKCPICENTKFKKIFQKKWVKSSFVKCIHCKLIFQNPQEDYIDTKNRYQETYFNYEKENQENFFGLIKKTLDDYNILSLLPKKSNILEIGSATGMFLKYMQDNGHKPIGLELCKESVDYGKKNYKVDLINKRLEDTEFPADHFDFIHFSHLIEHLNDPIKFLKIIHRIVKKTGLVLLTTPNSSGLFSNIFRENWRCIVDDHLFIFNKNNLIKLLDKTSFSVLLTKSWGSIPSQSRIKIFKNITDKFVKKNNIGDVISILFKKKP